VHDVPLALHSSVPVIILRPWHAGRYLILAGKVEQAEGPLATGDLPDFRWLIRWEEKWRLVAAARADEPLALMDAGVGEYLFRCGPIEDVGQSFTLVDARECFER